MFIASGINVDEIKEGDSVFLNDEAAINIGIKVHGGKYKVYDVNYSTTKDETDEYKVYAYVELLKEIRGKEYIISVVLNYRGHVILSTKNMPDGLKMMFDSVAAFIKANENRFECIGCGRKLNIPFHNVRICDSCENSSNKIDEEIMEVLDDYLNEEEIEDNWGDAHNRTTKKIVQFPLPTP